MVRLRNGTRIEHDREAFMLISALVPLGMNREINLRWIANVSNSSFNEFQERPP